MNPFTLRFNPKYLLELASRYIYPLEESAYEVMESSFKRKYLTKPDFIKITKWKTPRTQKRCASNSSEFIKEITATALNTKNEQLKIEVLTLLEGVSYPTASTILHFTTKFRYPIIDFRALWSLQLDVPKKYTFQFWWEYTLVCRKLAKEYKISLRTLDKALWQYSKENQ